LAGTLFISDLHLDPNRPNITRAFARFLHDNRRCERLYILGDLVESWIGDDDNSPLVTEIATLLSAFTDAGPQLFIMHGNRDFLIGESFCQRIKAQLITDPTVIDLCGEPTLLMHGDSLCTDDLPYQEFRSLARSAAWQQEFLAHSLSQRIAIAADMRAKSKVSNSNKAQDIMDVSQHAVDQALRKHGVKRLIHGHTHRPAQHITEHGTRWVLGDWCEKGWHIEATETAIELLDWTLP
jgi:UDP-2,3-diacylglucosamine hydrolase